MGKEDGLLFGKRLSMLFFLFNLCMFYINFLTKNLKEFESPTWNENTEPYFVSMTINTTGPSYPLSFQSQDKINLEKKIQPGSGERSYQPQEIQGNVIE